jgi:transposase InsO family protein
MRRLLRPSEDGAVLSSEVASLHLEQFIQELDSYIRWYNEKRIKVSLGSLSPFEYRESLGIAA